MSNCPDPDVVALMVDNCLIGWTPRREVEVVITGFKTKNTTISCEMSIEGHELRVKTRDGRKRRRKSDVSPEWGVAVPAPYLPVLINKPPKRRTVRALKRGIVNDPKKEAEERKKALNRSTMNQEAITAALLGLSQSNGTPTPGSSLPSFSPPPLADQLAAQEAGLPLDTSKTAIPSQGRPKNDEGNHQVNHQEYHQEYQNFQPYQFPLRHKPLRSKTRSKNQKTNNELSETFGIPEMLTMVGERTYPCEDCEYSAGRRDHLKRHMLTIHNKVLMSRQKMMERAHPGVFHFNSSTNAPPYRYLPPDISAMYNPLNYDQRRSRVSFATKKGAHSNSQFIDLTKKKSDADSFRSFKDDRQQVVKNQQIAEINSQIIMPATDETFLGGNTVVPSKSNDVDKSLSSLDGWTRLGYLNSSGHIENYFIKELKDDDDSNDSDPTNVTTQRQKKYAMFRKVLHAKQFQSKPESAKDYQINIPDDQVSQMLVDYVKYPQQYRGGKVSSPAKKSKVGDSRNAGSNSGDATHTADDTAHKSQHMPSHQLLRQREYENARELAERAALQSQQQRQQQQQQQQQQHLKQQAQARARAQQEAAAATAAQKLQVQTYAEQQHQLQQQIDLQNAEHIQQLNQLRQLQQMQGYGAASTPEYPFQQLQYLQQQQQAYPPPQFNLPIQGFSGLPSVLPQQFFPPFNVNVGGYQQSSGLNDSAFPLGYPQAIQPMYPNVLPIDISASSYYLPNNHNNLN